MAFRIIATGLAVLALTAGSGAAQAPSGAPVLRQLAAEVDPGQLRASIQRMVGFGTRHSLSDPRQETRGIGAARRWVEARFLEIGAECGGCLTITKPSQIVTGTRIPTPTEIVDVLAIQRGATDPNRVIIISGHLDSINSNNMDPLGDAPGANDDASGVAAVLETARVLSKRRFAATLVYAVLSGEEQGLYGGKVLADYALAQGWQVEAVLNNDIVGNTHGMSGVVDNSHVRVFSEGVRANETAAQAAARRSNGGELDSPARNLARYMDRLADETLTNLDVLMIYRTDRYGRSGDEVRMLEAGFPAIRVTEAAEHYDRQHQTIRTENGRSYGDTIEWVDFPYLAQVTRLNLVTMAALASAPPPPLEVRITGALRADTTVTWTTVPGAAGYRVWWRSTTEPQWRFSRPAGPQATSLVLPGVIIDDWFFGVSAVSADGLESPVQFPAPVGSFFPPPPAPPAPPRAAPAAR